MACLMGHQSVNALHAYVIDNVCFNPLCDLWHEGCGREADIYSSINYVSHSKTIIFYVVMEKLELANSLQFPVLSFDFDIIVSRSSFVVCLCVCVCSHAAILSFCAKMAPGSDY